MDRLSSDMRLVAEMDVQFDEVKDAVSSAGILPVSFNQNNELVVLLGKERFVMHWRGSLRWSGFEGGRKPHESVEHAAVREFSEESLQVLSLGNNYKLDSLVARLQDHAYVARVLLCIDQNDARADRRFHTTYILQVPYQPSCVDTFASRRQTLETIHTSYAALEARRVKLAATCPRFWFENMTSHDGSNVTAVNVWRVHDGVMCSCAVNGVDDMIIVRHDQNEPEDMEYLAWFKERDDLAKTHAQFIHSVPDCMNIVRNSRGAITHIDVKDDIMEKQCVQWWSLDDLHSVLHNGGHHKGEFFRAYFLPVLERAVMEFDSAVQNDAATQGGATHVDATQGGATD